MACPLRLSAHLSWGLLVHILVTTDTLSGVWSYTRELVAGLIGRGTQVTLVSLGEIPLPQQTAWMENLQGLNYIPTAFRLDWMQEGECDLKDSFAYLTALVARDKARPAAFESRVLRQPSGYVPRIVVAHGDLISWWKAVHGREPDDSRWLTWYREVMMWGFRRPAWWSRPAPGCWMRSTPATFVRLVKPWSIPAAIRLFFNPYVTKEDSVLAVGRLWDAGKQVSLVNSTHASVAGVYCQR